ncbi:MAG TPA: hypothetical protein VIZ28_13930 [Chitinophagaceae bacterium]
MYFKKTIQRPAAGLMLLLFVLSITPKQLLHDAITGHKHSYVRVDAGMDIRTDKNNFQCDWQQLEVESPFTHQPDLRLEHPVIIHSSPVNYYTLNSYSAERILTSLRGPPNQA